MYSEEQISELKSLVRLLNEQRDAVMAENEKLKKSVEYAAGCIIAVESVVLIEALEEKDGKRLAELVHRRLCNVYLEVKTSRHRRNPRFLASRSGLDM